MRAGSRGVTFQTSNLYSHFSYRYYTKKCRYGRTNMFWPCFSLPFFHLDGDPIGPPCTIPDRDGHQGAWPPTVYLSMKTSDFLLSLAFNKHRIKICVSCYWRCPGTSAPSTPYLCNAEGNTWDKVEGPWRVPSDQATLQWIKTETNKLLEGTEEKSFSTTRCHCFAQQTN